LPCPGCAETATPRAATSAAPTPPSDRNTKDLFIESSSSAATVPPSNLALPEPRYWVNWLTLLHTYDSSATTEWRWVPMPSTVQMAVSPARIQRGSARSMFVPAGLPPEIRSPGFRVRMFDA